ncbi:hypothetical protein Poli38472_006870 [Pythium oligandrum]|uniref:Peroxisomal biogenesis factor 3 n=1 Tax=Pythium oligandrum TaxID=41045 RepID=A0A8K1C5L1_PYTOL|nr:hypothetical protein Poli38472_006870 [Pythium oligandrum]|eukprot:TMW56860.1 hypothetical protein Poli38472_006870 [Pythium oligandrum]
MWSALEHATARVCGFVRRHKKLVVATGVASLCVGGVYYGYKRMVTEAERFGLQLQRQMAEHQRLQLSLASTTEESNATIQRFLPRLKKTLYQLVDLESIVQELKTLDKAQKPKRIQLWEQAKLTAVTRYFTALIAFGLWHLLVFAQIAIIGKRTFEKNKNEWESTRREADEHQALAAQHAFLASGLEYFLTDGIARIQKHVESVVAANEQLQTWEVSRKLKVERDELNELLQSIYLSIIPTDGTQSAEVEALWRSFLIYPDKRDDQDEHVISLLNDLWDLLETDLFGPALQDSLGFLCGNAFQDLNEVVYGCTSRRFVETEEELRAQGQQQKASPALAKLIPALQTEVNKLLTNSGPESYLVKYSQGVGEMERFRNFYEAIFFMQEEDEAVMQLI